MTDHKDDYYIRQVLEGKTEAFAFLVEKYKDMVLYAFHKDVEGQGGSRRNNPGCFHDFLPFFTGIPGRFAVFYLAVSHSL